MKKDIQTIENILKQSITTDDIVQSISHALSFILAHTPIASAILYWNCNNNFYSSVRGGVPASAIDELKDFLESIEMSNKPHIIQQLPLHARKFSGNTTFVYVIVPLVVHTNTVGYAGLIIKSRDYAALKQLQHFALPALYHLSLLLAHGECVFKFKQSQHEAINGMLAVIQALDPYTRDHSLNVANYALLLAEELKLPSSQINIIHYGALFHDIGKIGTSPEILKKRGPLSSAEYALIKDHPAKGVTIISQFSEFKPLIPIIKSHHERFDGSGYPDGLKGDDIPFNARLVAVVDIYDAITTNRVYRKAQERKRALDEIIKNTPKQFDPEIVKAFVRVIKNL
jgi:putative nucleotidyltransferase with HDIG domain